MSIDQGQNQSREVIRPAITAPAWVTPNEQLWDLLDDSSRPSPYG